MLRWSESTITVIYLPLPYTNFANFPSAKTISIIPFTRFIQSLSIVVTTYFKVGSLGKVDNKRLSNANRTTANNCLSS